MARSIFSRNPEARTEFEEDPTDAHDILYGYGDLDDDHPPRRSYYRFTMAALIAVVSAAGLWYAYTTQGRVSDTEEVKLIRADSSPTKHRPDISPGGGVTEDDRDVYDMGKPQSRVERLLPPPEEPLPKPAAPAQIAAAAPPQPTTTASPAQPAASPPPLTASEGGSAPAPATPAVTAVPALPPLVASVPPPPTTPVVQAKAPTVPAASVQVAQSVAPTPKVPTAPIQAAQTAAPTPKAPAAAKADVAPPPPTAHTDEPAAVQSAVSAPATSPVVTGTGGYRVQIAAARDEGIAHQEWSRLMTSHPELLTGLSEIVRRVDLGDKGIFYRLQAGPLKDHDSAAKLCGQLQAVSVGCLVVKSE